MIRSELLSPAGSMDALRAAVQNGADALYFGASDFNARRNADNFGGTLDTAVSYCHIYGVRSFITLNTMVREDELPRLQSTIEEIASAGADGVIVEDIGTADLVHRIAPDIELHASTQMAVHNASGVEFLLKHGFHRVVLAREMSIPEIRECADTGAELEVFVHGALCVSCSGQCLMSSMIGGRSGNRGLCAQPCRMKYDAENTSGYLLSTRDLCALDQLKEILDAGAYSLKLEGRLKRPEYVGLTTRVYREAIDALSLKKPFDVKARTEELAQMFNRGGFTNGYFAGIEESRLMFAKRPNNLGVEIGDCKKDGIIRLSKDALGADALVLRRGDRDIPVHPGTIHTGNVSIKDARIGDRLIRLVSEDQMAGERKYLDTEPKKIPVIAKCILKVGIPSVLILSDGRNTISVEGSVAQIARSGHTDESRIISQIEKTGDTPYKITHIELICDNAVFIPVSDINALRRDACTKLSSIRCGKPHDVHIPSIPTLEHESKTIPDIIVQSSDPDVLRRALAAGVNKAAYRPNDLRRDSLAQAFEILPEKFSLVLPPVMTESSLQILHEYANKFKARISETWLSNISHFNLDWPGEKWGDSQLNVANNITAERLLSWGLNGYTPSVELNCAQLKALGGHISLIVYGRLPLMELRHCPYRNIHGLKGPHNSCRRCDHAIIGSRLEDIHLTDKTAACFPLRRIAADTGCVIELLNSAPLMLLRKSVSLPTCDSWRLLIESGEDVETITEMYLSAAKGIDIRKTDAFIRFCPENITTGHYFRGVL